MRAYWAAQDAPQARPAAVVSILLERVLGLTATVLVGAALILPHWSDLTDHPVTRAGAYAFLIVTGILLFCCSFWVIPRQGKFSADRRRWDGERWQEKERRLAISV